MLRRVVFDKEKTIAFSGEVSRGVAAAINGILRSKGNRYTDALLDIPLKKAQGTTLQRATLFSAILESQRVDWREHIQIAASIELLVSSMYLHNRIFDNKGGIDFSHTSTLGRHIIAGNLCKELACDILRYETGVDMERVFRWSSEACDYGQHLAFESRNAFSPFMSRDGSLMLMLSRTYCINAAFFQGIGAIAGALSDVKSERTDALARWCCAFGMLVQFVNDIADFVPPSFNESTLEKIPSDAFSDLRKMELSLVLNRLFHANGDLSSEESCLRSAGKSGVIRSSMRLCHHLARSLARKAADEGFGQLMGMAFMGLSNRYFRDIKSMMEKGVIARGEISDDDARENSTILEIVMNAPEKLWATLPEHLKPRFEYR